MDFLKKNNGSEYLVFDYTDEYKEVQTKYAKLWDWIKNEIETINGVNQGEYGKDLMKIKFKTDDNLPLNELIMFDMLTIVVRSVFEEDSKFYPQIYLDKCLDES